jgi:hypothetical protein
MDLANSRRDKVARDGQVNVSVALGKVLLALKFSTNAEMRQRRNNHPCKQFMYHPGILSISGSQNVESLLAECII